jgi:hypothetical protein
MRTRWDRLERKSVPIDLSAYGNVSISCGCRTGPPGPKTGPLPDRILADLKRT